MLQELYQEGSQEQKLIRNKHKSQEFLRSQEFSVLDIEPMKLSRHRSQEYIAHDSSEHVQLSRSQEYTLAPINDSTYYLARSLPFMGPDVSSHSNQMNINLNSGLEAPTNLSSFNSGQRSSSPTALLSPILSDTDAASEKKSSALSAALESNHRIEQEQMLEASLDKSKRIGMLSTIRTDVQKVKSLLSILQSVVQLKESTGCERAMLSSLMALGPGIDSDRDESTTKLLNDLVVEEANQRMIINKLQSACKGLDLGEPLSSMSRGSSSALLGKFLIPSKEMEQVQELIKNFDLEGLQNVMPLKNFWEIITI
jgi:hypothetical protein